MNCVIKLKIKKCHLKQVAAPAVQGDYIKKVIMMRYLYGFVHVSSTQRLQGDSERSPCWIQVVLHHLRTKYTKTDRTVYRE